MGKEVTVGTYCACPPAWNYMLGSFWRRKRRVAARNGRRLVSDAFRPRLCDILIASSRPSDRPGLTADRALRASRFCVWAGGLRSRGGGGKGAVGRVVGSSFVAGARSTSWSSGPTTAGGSWGKSGVEKGKGGVEEKSRGRAASQAIVSAEVAGAVEEFWLDCVSPATCETRFAFSGINRTHKISMGRQVMLRQRRSRPGFPLPASLSVLSI